ncbi:MAG: hypothetical protein QM754_00390 [Tepidisphaeraceae bacterium]
MPINFQTIIGDGRFGNFRAGLLGWPVWARYLLIVPMVPGILLLGLSILLLLVSLVALFVLTVPVYTLLDRLLSVRNQGQNETYRSPGSKRVDAVIRDA